mgnify:CR=1 FL=1
MAGLPEPKVVSTLANRGKQIDAAVDSALTPQPAVPAVSEKKYEKPITAAEAEANQARRKAADAAEEAKRGMPKPSLLERAKKFITGE